MPAAAWDKELLKPGQGILEEQPHAEAEDAADATHTFSMVTSFPAFVDHHLSNFKNIGLLVFTCLAVVVLIFASHAPAAELAIFYVADFLAVAFVVFYAALRYTRNLGEESLTPACLILAWLLSLLISLSAPSRRRKLLGVAEADALEVCEEGNIALWLALVLTSITVFVPMPFHVLAVFGQLISLQHLILGLILQRPECSEDDMPRFLLGLPPLWTSWLQLHVLAGLLSLVRWPRNHNMHFQAKAFRYVQASYLRRKNSKAFNLSSGLAVDKSEVLVQNWIERLVQEMHAEEEHCHQFLSQHVHDKSEASESRAWRAIVESLLNVLVSCGRKLQERAHTTDVRWRQDLAEAFKESADNVEEEEQSGVHVWLAESFMSGDRQYTKLSDDESMSLEDLDGNGDVDYDTPSPFGSEDMMTPRSRSQLRLFTTPGLRIELHIGEWSFDALAVEREHKSVLQILGFELLRPFSPSIMPRMALSSFLRELEDAYVANNAYHSHVHGADMCNSFFFLVVNTDLWSKCQIPDSSKVAMIIAALGHDVGHFARNNAFLVNLRHPLALTYNDRSVLENFHASTLMNMLAAGIGPVGIVDSKPVCKQNLLASLSAEQLHKARQLMITLILDTDTQKHLEDLASFRLHLGPGTFNPFDNPDDQQQSIGMLFRTADISHSAKNWEIHMEWSIRIAAEFHEQGDEEKRLGLKVSPLCEREGFVLHKAQVGFLQFICLPTWREITRLEAIKVQRAIKEQFAATSAPISPCRHSRKPMTIASFGKRESDPTMGSPMPPFMLKRSSSRVLEIEKRLGKPGRPRTKSQNSEPPETMSHSTTMPATLHAVTPSSPETSPAASLDEPLNLMSLMPTALISAANNVGNVPGAKGHLQMSEAPTSKIAGCCLFLCEQNLQAWKRQGEVEAKNKNQGEVEDKNEYVRKVTKMSSSMSF